MDGDTSREKLLQTGAEGAISPEEFQVMLKEACLAFDQEMRQLPQGVHK